MARIEVWQISSGWAVRYRYGNRAEQATHATLVGALNLLQGQCEASGMSEAELDAAIEALNVAEAETGCVCPACEGVRGAVHS